MTWHKGQPFRVVDCLDCLDAEIRAFAPRAVPPATDPKAWGSLADDEHATTSDHYPHFYAALGAEAVVCARDFPHAPALGLDGHAVTEALRQSRDPRIGYVIFAGRIFSGHVVDGVPAWTWRPYTGKDKHGTHFHVSSVHDKRADSTAPWHMPGSPTGDTDMDATQDKRLADVHYALTSGPLGPEQVRWSVGMGKLDALVKAAAADEVRDNALAAALAALGTLVKGAGGSLDAAPIVAAINAAADKQTAAVTALQERVAELEHELEATRAAAEANLSDAEKQALAESAG